MQLELIGADARPGLTIDVAERGDVVEWTVTNRASVDVDIDRVRLRWRMTRRGRVRMLQHGWQSWSASGGVVVGEGDDPSRTPGVSGLLRAMHHADDGVTVPGERRSELVTVLADDDGAVCLGFDGGARHDGTFRVLDDDVMADAYLGGAVLAPGQRRVLHSVRVRGGDVDEALEDWATWAGAASKARTAAPYQVGWCSWYHYFHDISEAALRDNLARAADWPFDVFQLDDGYQASIGDWLDTADSFPSPLADVAAEIAAAGRVPGVWIAPFLASPASRLAAAHPDWIVHRASGRPMIGMVNPGWGGEQYVLDTSNPAVLEHLEGLAATLASMGWRYLKLDFTYAPSFTAEWSDPTMTPAERVRAGYDAVRRGAGDDVFILGCGAPLGPCIGAVDGMRIGPDVAPRWSPHPDRGGYDDTTPATVNAWRNTLVRSFMHRRLWLNDPDCLMLRTEKTHLTTDQLRAWAHAVAASGGMALVSDDLALLGPEARALLDEVVAVGRAVDGQARPPRCPDLLDAWTPTTLESPAAAFVGDPVAGRARLVVAAD